ncbi:Pub1 protein [Saccharomycopsis crataegensis]|uniref:Pub1 protein n=1 Tax=Saccharomycopsis crataegensis TaxID=43959 RepID=A0AAV5QLM4_9ASCO|nr:Pub1 protein [Saccharomycopsis crataegensis]
MSSEQIPSEVPVSGSPAPAAAGAAPVAAAPGSASAPEGAAANPIAPPQPEVTPANAIEGGREMSNNILYVSGLPKSVTEEMLRELFNVTGQVQSVKILFDKNRPGYNYAFIEYDNGQSAEMAKHTLSGRSINNSEISINWAFQSQSTKTTDTFNLFVGDLSSEVNDDLLGKTFGGFQSLTSAHVMWDMQTGRSRGYGFVSFNDQAEAEQALQTMNGEWIGGRQIRLNWASHKQKIPSGHNHHHHNGGFQNGPNGVLPPPSQNVGAPLQQNGGPNNNGNVPMGLNPVQTYEFVLRQSPTWQTTVYIGNLAHFTSQNELIPLLQTYGFIVDFKFHPEKGCAFVKYDSHERAAVAIVQLSGYNFNGRMLKSGWGKDTRPPPTMQYNNYRVVYGQQH